MVKLGIGVLVALGVLACVGYFVGRYMYFKIRYRTVGPYEAMVITGKDIGDNKQDKSIFKDEETGRHMKIVRGGGHLLRFKQTATKINLNSFQLQIATPKIITKDYVGIYGEAVATIKVADGLDGIVKYAEQFLGKDQKEIEVEVREVLGSNLRAILAKMTVEEINGDRESFNDQVREIAQDQLDMMGFQITSLGLTDLRDDDDYLENLGKPQVVKTQKQADIATAVARQETELKKAEVDEIIEKERLKREMSIADERKEKELNDSRILAETNKEKAIAEAAYDLEQEERRLAVEEQRIAVREQEKAAELRIRKLERENDVEIAEKQVEVERQRAEAEYVAKTKLAEAEAAAKIAAGEADAEVIKKKAEAEVEAIEKRAEALNKHQDVILREKLIEIMPEYARAVSESLSNVESIRILDSGEGKQINSLPSTVTKLMAAAQESMGQMTGFDLENFLEELSGKGKDGNNKENYGGIKINEHLDVDNIDYSENPFEGIEGKLDKGNE